MSSFSPEYLRLLAFDLTLLHPMGDARAAARLVGDAKIDPNPHQIDAALFAYRALKTGGAILADEVGLGKTIEAGLVLSQYWAEGKNRILVICPVPLRRQWQSELENLFYLQSEVVTSQDWKRFEKETRNPVERNEPGIFIVSDHVVFANSSSFRKAHWDLIIIDEAHRFRNVFKKEKQSSKVAKQIRDTFVGTAKLLLTATPFQNNLNELYGLVSIIDSSYFGNFESFQRVYNPARAPGQKPPVELRDRISPIFKRALRKEVAQYLRYTNRIPVTIYHRYDDKSPEQDLHDDMVELLRSEYVLLRHRSIRGFFDLVYLKLLGSSPYALNPALLKLVARFLQGLVKGGLPEKKFNSWLNYVREEIEAYPDFVSHWSTLEEIACGGADLSYQAIDAHVTVSDPDIEDLEEDDELLEFIGIARKGRSSNDLEALENPEAVKKQLKLIIKNYFRTLPMIETGRGTSFIKALQNHTSEALEKGLPKKAVVFTEYYRTLKYVRNLIETSDLKDFEIIEYHGGLSSKKNSEGLSDRDLALQRFREAEKAIFITTEAGAEGLNLQFCNLVVNYDLPWNPQRIEQRIGRAHRYGQINDVVVVSFVCEQNPAEGHIFNLLSEKFHLFEGVFGASNSVLGAIESGFDIEKIFADLYLGVRSAHQAQTDLERFVEETKDIRESGVRAAASKLLADFDPEAAKVLKINWEKLKEEVTFNLSQQEMKLADLLRAKLTSLSGPDNKGRFTVRDASLPVLSSRPHTISRIYATPDLPLASIRHPEIADIINQVKEQVYEFSHQAYQIDVSLPDVAPLKLTPGQEYLFCAFCWRASGPNNFERLELALTDKDGMYIRNGRLIDVARTMVRTAEKVGSVDDYQCERLIMDVQREIAEQREEISQRIFSQALNQKMAARLDQETAERLLLDERNRLSNELDLQILRAPMGEKVKILKQRDKVLTDFDKELSVFRATIDEIKSSERSLIKELESLHSNGQIHMTTVFRCTIKTV